MKNQVLKMSALLLSFLLIVVSIMFFASKDKEPVYDDLSGIRVPKNMANVQEIMPCAPETFYAKISYYDDEQGKRVSKVYNDNEKVIELFEAIDSETWHYIDERRDRGSAYNLTCYASASMNDNAGAFSISVYENCIYVKFVDVYGKSKQASRVAPKDGESDVYEKMLAIVNDAKTQSN